MIPWNVIYAHIVSDKRRTALTIIGIVIAVFSVYSLLTLGEGFEQGIISQFEEVGLNTLLVQERSQGFASGFSSRGLTDEEYEVVKNTPGISSSTYTVMRPVEVTVGDRTIFPTVMGIPLDEDIELAYSLSSIDIDQGRLLQDRDESSVTIGSRYTDSSLFDSPLRQRSTVSVNNESYRVAGIHSSLGSREDDLLIVGSVDAFFPDEAYTYIVAEPSGSPEEVIDRLERNLRRQRSERRGEESFVVQRVADFISSFTDILSTFQTVVVVVAGISLIVGGIGVVNTMRMSVMQRRSSIGVMKSIGASNKIIFITFLIEALLLGFIGGVIGIGSGIIAVEAFSLLLQSISSINLLIIQHNPILIGTAILGTTILGGIAGAYPAWNASTLDPVEVLEEE